MKFWGIFRFELAHQLRRPWPWLSLVALIVFAFMSTRVAIVPVTLPKDFILNSSFIITSVSVFSCQLWLLLSPAVAGEAAARDVHARLHPLIYTSPISKAEYLGGRFLAAFTLNAMILLGVQIGSLLAAFGPGANPEIIGPFQPQAYLAAYVFIALTNAFIGTTVQFSAALFSGRPMASYVGSMGLFFLSYPVTFALYFSTRQQQSLLVDPIGVFAIMNEMMSNWTLVEKNVRMFTLEGTMLLNRVLWIGISSVILLGVYARFRFAHRTTTDLLRRLTHRFRARPASFEGASRGRITIATPQVAQSFGFGIQLRQTFAIAWSSFRMIATTPAGVFMLAVFPMFVVLVLLSDSEQWNVPLIPRTGYIVAKYLTSPITQFMDFRVMVPLLIIYFSGELVWRERDAGLSENVDATSVPEWVLLLGKYLGLSLALVAFLLSMTAAGMVAQTIMGYHDYRIDLYFTLFGLQLPDYLLFAALALGIHAIVNHKHVGLLAALLAHVLIAFAAKLGIKHNLLIYAGGPWWSYTDMRGFSTSLGPWLWFKLYWAAWALLVVVSARLFWARGRDLGLRTRLHIARRRFTGATTGAAAFALALILVFGGFIFYNTNVLNEYITDDEMVNRRAEYEKRFGKYEDIPQPEVAAAKLRVEIYPDRRAATIHGTYNLVNADDTPIAAVHLEPAFYVKTKVSFDRGARLTEDDKKLGHSVYTLEEPLQPGDSMTLMFDVDFKREGFRNTGSRSSGAGVGIVENGTYFTGGALPLIGYQAGRELTSADERRKHGLPRQLTLAELSDIDPSVSASPPAKVEVIVGTTADQVAVAPGVLQRTWTEGGRRYFHYDSGVPINGEVLFFSAAYEMHRERYRNVDVQIYLHPTHTEQLQRMLRSTRAALDYYSTQFGEYPYPFLQIVEQPGNFFGMGVDGSGVITGGEGFFRLDPQPNQIDPVFLVVAHEMGHQWWGMQLRTAFAEGGGVISEGLAWYSTLQLVNHVDGPNAVRRFMEYMRQPDPWPPIRTGMPLLRAMDPWANYRKAPYAFYAVSQYIGEERVNRALYKVVEAKRNSLATTLDVYRELQAVTPDSMQYLLRDLFETNTIWELDADEATATKMSSGAWEVTMKVRARKVVSDSAGVETVLSMNEMIPIGVFARTDSRDELSAPLHFAMHRIRSGEQTIKVTVPREPALAGIDPHHLLDWVESENDDNIVPVETGTKTGGK